MTLAKNTSTQVVDYCVEGRSCYYKDVNCTQDNLVVSFHYHNNGAAPVASG